VLNLTIYTVVSGLLLGAPAPPPEIVALTSTNSAAPSFFITEPPPALIAQIHGTTWHPGCPVSIEDLKLLHLTYWDFSAIPRDGLLLVNKSVAAEVQSIFEQLFAHGFLIERMQPVEEYGGSDGRSMAANNTSAFNCRDVTGKPGQFSNHSWGLAIDINPLTNPMLLHGKPLPPEGARYIDRTKASPGAILAESFIVRLFESRGWTWGGTWTDPDYQHFEKPSPKPLH
jgi:hypothetical protein